MQNNNGTYISSLMEDDPQKQTKNNGGAAMPTTEGNQSNDPFTTFIKNNPAPDMNTPYNPANGSYASFLSNREQDPAVQEWARKARAASQQAIDNPTYTDIPGYAEPGGVAGPSQSAPEKSEYSGPKLSDKPFIIGFDSEKLASPDSGSAAGSKYTPAAKLFGRVAQTVGIQRGNLGVAVDIIKQNGFPNAKTVGDDKIDFGDGNGPIDVIRSDGQPVFQNTTGNPVWEQQYAGGAGGHSGGGTSTGLAGDQAGATGGTTTSVSDDLKSLLQKYYGGASPMRIGAGSSPFGSSHES